MIDSGAMHETQVPFDEDENKYDENSHNLYYKMPHTLTLKEPIEWGKNTRKEITFKNRLKLGMYMHWIPNQVMQFGSYVPIIAQMTGETEEFIKDLSAPDANECITIVNYFFLGL